MSRWRGKASRVAASLDETTGVLTAARRFLDHDIPASAGWPQVFGSIALFLFLTQAFTGLLLALNYAPTPSDSYNSARYIMREVTGGALVRSLHHWGASFMVVVVAMHMAQVFLYGAYKKPRQATWIAGVVLLLITLAYGLTGYLLPGDARAYWGTVVTTRIAAQTPLAGGLVARLLGADNGAVGAVTFTRFYAAHVILLPLLTVLLVGAHLALVRRHGIARAPGASPGTRKFFPGQIFKDTVAIFVTFAALFLVASLVRAPLGYPADPADDTFVPRPEWYFLFLFQLLKLFPGWLEPFATVVLPSTAVVVLFLLPFLDRKPVLRWSHRAASVMALCLVAAGWTWLTVAAVRGTPASGGTEATPAEWRRLTPEQLAGLAYFQSDGCGACHNLDDWRPFSLEAIARRKGDGWLAAHFSHPRGSAPPGGAGRPQQDGPKFPALSAFLRTLPSLPAGAPLRVPQPVLAGALLFRGRGCEVCHAANGSGGKIGPALNGLAARRTREWVERHFENPQSLSPGSMMPAYHFTVPERDALVSFLFALPDGAP